MARRKRSSEFIERKHFSCGPCLSRVKDAATSPQAACAIHLEFSSFLGSFAAQESKTQQDTARALAEPERPEVCSFHSGDSDRTCGKPTGPLAHGSRRPGLLKQLRQYTAQSTEKCLCNSLIRALRHWVWLRQAHTLALDERSTVLQVPQSSTFLHHCAGPTLPS